MSARNIVIAAVVALAAAIAGYFAYSANQKSQQQAALRQLVTETTAILRESLAKAPAADSAAKLDANLQAVAAPRDRAFADAAEHYILGAREIVRRRLDADRLLEESAAARRGLAAHMARPSVPRERWIHTASELKRRVEAQHADLGRMLKALDELLFSMSDAQKRLEPHAGAGLLIENEAVEAARKRGRDDAARAAADLDRTRALAPR